MAVYNILPTTNLKWDDIRDTLNAGGVSTAFSASAKINRWSKYKPVVIDNPFPTNSDWWKGDDGKCGLVISTYTSVENLVKDIGNWYKYIGNTGLYKRLGDFRGYYRNAVSPIYNMKITPSSLPYAAASKEVRLQVDANVSSSNNDLSLNDLPINLGYLGFAVYKASSLGGEFNISTNTFVAYITAANPVGTTNAVSIDMSDTSVYNTNRTYYLVPFLAKYVKTAENSYPNNQEFTPLPVEGVALDLSTLRVDILNTTPGVTGKVEANRLNLASRCNYTISIKNESGVRIKIDEIEIFFNSANTGATGDIHTSYLRDIYIEDGSTYTNVNYFDDTKTNKVKYMTIRANNISLLATCEVTIGQG